MELKHAKTQKEMQEASLLIVPYGIETVAKMVGKMQTTLLIVPYGIETYL